MHRIIVTGSGTNVGKTVTAAVIATRLKADYWKPVECGTPTDTEIMRTLIDPKHVHAPTYSLKAPVSPHQAAHLEDIIIGPMDPPKTDRLLVIETAGGLLVPYSHSRLSIDQFSKWRARWVIVCRLELGCINHTLLTVEALKRRRLPILGVVFNGNSNPATESAICSITQLQVIGRLAWQTEITASFINRMAEEWAL